MSYRKLQWLFPVAVAVHNAEEALTMPRWVHEHCGMLPFCPQAGPLRLALLVSALAAFAVTTLSARNGKQSFAAYLLFGGMFTMLLNVFVPHLPATLHYRQYTPGVITAVAINLPLMSYLMVRGVRDGWVSGRKAFAYAVLVPLAIGGAIFAFFRLAS